MKEKTIAFFCGKQFTPWSPKNIKNLKNAFLGGSEEAVVYLTRELAKLGWRITVVS